MAEKEDDDMKLSQENTIKIKSWVGALLFSICVSFGGWTIYMENRLSRVEVLSGEMRYYVDKIEKRGDDRFSRIEASLIRIEAKLDRKVDK